MVAHLAHLPQNALTRFLIWETFLSKSSLTNGFLAGWLAVFLAGWQTGELPAWLASRLTSWMTVPGWPAASWLAVACDSDLEGFEAEWLF